MKNNWKPILFAGVLILVCAGVSWGVTRFSVTSSLSDIGSSSFLPETTMSDYGFKQANYSLTSNQEVGSAPDLTPAAEAAVHAVVHIKVEEEQSYDQQYIDPFEFFFGGGSGMGRSQSRPVTSFGSGVIISTDGYIITNNHVIEGAKKVQVRLNDNRSFLATVVGGDAASDIALIKIDADNLTTLPFGNSDDIKLGEWVLAVGNPFNLTSTVTAGIVSAKARTAESGTPGDSKISSYIQTDAAINSGNSGGALVNAKGELIGINTMIYSQTGNYAGYSFAVPINLAAKVVADIRKYGSVQRAFLGIVGGDITEELKEKYNLKVNNGAFVVDFSEISAAYAAGIEKEDVIVELNGKPIESMSQLQSQIGRYRPGDKVRVIVDRKGKKHSYDILLKNIEGSTGVLKQNTGSTVFGASLKRMSGQEMRSLGVSYGLEVTDIKSGKFKSAGIEKGDIILSLNNAPVRTVEEAQRIVSKVQAQKGKEKGLIVRAIDRKTHSLKLLVVDLS